MPAVTTARAARLARRLSPTHTRDDARDALDAMTDWSLAPAELDALTDAAIEARVEASASREPRRTRLHELIARRATIAELVAVFGGREAETAGAV